MLNDNNNGNGIEFLDLLAIISFAIQITNRQSLISLDDVQGEISKAVQDIHEHLQEQDSKIDKIVEAVNNDKN